ncbi:hypothetical protein [Dyadobacter sp. CY343]|uniref:hypothetical protein n=1 Tax=Dyadobacter sp. CY343 TaxID=2907299 RepID=UPI001F3C9084|nr:hypothetical protein [Dyadobacter sp. CY343]MCE7062263.1 hypothetical protein [Dyadobacter sp. CY343]
METIHSRPDLEQEKNTDHAEKDAALLEFMTEFRQSQSSMEELQHTMEKYPGLLSGEHYWRTISKNGQDFSASAEVDELQNQVIAFSSISNASEILCAINLHQGEHIPVYVTLDDNLHPSGSKMYCLYASANSPAELNVEDRNGKAVRLTIPPRALVIYG